MMNRENSSLPLVSVICLCYRHEKFVEEALTSVFNQTYPHIEIILVDDGSPDRSVEVIEKFLTQHTSDKYPVRKLYLSENRGNCRAFNEGFALANGQYIIDFATDDVMLPERVALQVAFFETLPSDYGVLFTESQYIDEAGHPLGLHYQDRFRHLKKIPTGDVYADVLSRYFISSPTMIYKREVLDLLGGYDDRLAYEDFDFWVRSARHYRYAYLDKCTTQVRKSQGSLSTKSGSYGDKQLYSTYLVCKKAMLLNRTTKEKNALVKRIQYELRQSVLTGNQRETQLFLGLLYRLQGRFNFFNLLYQIIGFGMRGATLRRLLKM